MPTSTSISAAFPLGTRVNDAGHLEIGGCDVIELAREYGTPAYVVAEDDIRTRARSYVDALAKHHPDSDVLFASKAFPSPAVYRVLAEEGLSCDVASGGELYLALHAGLDPDRIYLHGNAKDDAELRFALDSGVGQIVVDNLDEVDRLERLVTGRQRVLLRVTPDVRGETHDSISTGQADSKFGFNIREAPAAIERLRASDSLDLLGLHIHLGSQLLSLEPWRRAITALAALGDFPVVNVGGGLGVVYEDGQSRPPSIEEFVGLSVSAVNELMGEGKRILFEPGRSLVANAGVTLYSVVSVKRNVSTYVAVDGGMSDNLRPMLYGAKYEAHLADRPGGGGERCHVAGKHCESGDIIIRDAQLSDPRAGDVLVTPTTGAYGHAMANNYNGVPRPPVIFCRDGQARVVTRRETFEDLITRDVF